MRTSIHNASKHTPNDYWTAESKVATSEGWIGTTRFKILSIKLPEGGTRPGRRRGPDCQRNKKVEDIANSDGEVTRLQEARRKRGFFEASSEDTDDLKVISQVR